MKKDIHPAYVVTEVTCTCGNKFETRSTATEGKIAYDAPGSTKWTATYAGLRAADVTRALRAESRILWLGRAPLTGNEQTVAARVWREIETEDRGMRGWVLGDFLQP